MLAIASCKSEDAIRFGYGTRVEAFVLSKKYETGHGVWNLLTDDLTAQSDECISFLAALLTNTK
jgi:hypothetical protein